MKTRLYIATIFVILACSCGQEEKDYAVMVDMMMGQMGNSNCVIGPQLPHGSVNPSPQTPNGENDGYDPTKPIRGFGQLHASGTGWGRYGQILVSPQRGFEPSETGHDSFKSDEVATPYYYGVTLDRYGVRTEVTPTHNCAAYRFTFSDGEYPDGQDANILIDIAHSIPQHIKPEIGGMFHGGNAVYDAVKRCISGWGEYSGGFGSGKPYKVYFAVRLDVKPGRVDVASSADSLLYVQVAFPDGVDRVHMNIGISMKSVANAELFLDRETGRRSFDEICAEAKSIWNKTLSAIEISTEDKDREKLFYTAFYHSLVMPRDRTGDNPWWGENGTPHFDDHYCVWDTWRTKYPLMVLLNESFVARNIESFIDRMTNNGMVKPTFTSALDFEAKQGGDDVDNVIADAIIKGVKGFDREKAYNVIRRNAFEDRSPEYLRLGWQPETGTPMSCSYGVEFAYNDFCVAQTALVMGDTITYELLSERASSWEKLFNAEQESHGFSGFISPRSENAVWLDYDPAKFYGPWTNFFYEGNSWIYSLFVPHGFDRLTELCGGEEQMVERLVYGFDNELIDLRNEPGFLTPFVFTHCDRPELTGRYVGDIRNTCFSLTGGYPDNEDSGAMGSWYVFTSLGLFPNAGQDFYYLLPPAFPEASLRMENGKAIKIKAEGLSGAARFIESVTVNGRLLDRAWIRHSEIAEGAEIVFRMTDREHSWATNGNAMYNGNR